MPTGDELPPEPGGAEDDRKGSKDALIESFGHLLGTVPDRVIAGRAGVSLRTVAAYRARKGVAGYVGPRSRAKTGRQSRIDPFADLVGTVADRVVAEKANVSVNAVRNWRRVRGVAAIGRGRPRGSVSMPPAVAPVGLDDAPAPRSTKRAPAAGAVAWKVEFADGETAVVVGVSIVAAADLAQRAGLITAMERVGAVL